MTTPNLSRATTFIWCSGRLIDRHRFAFQFLGGPREPVLAALVAYQNADGGFGHALEPDLRTPLSQPQPTEVALRLLDELDACSGPVVSQAAGWLSSVSTAEGGVPFVLTSVRDAPHAPWWEPVDHPPASVNPTAAIAGLMHRHGVEHPWLGPATEFCWRWLESARLAAGYDLASVLTFLGGVPDRSRAEEVFKRLGPVSVAAALQPPAEAGGPSFQPYDLAPFPSSPARPLIADRLMEASLDALAAEQEDDGGWPVPWPIWNPAGGPEWRAFLTVKALLTLRAYGRLA